MSDCPGAAWPAAPLAPPTDARAARLKKFERERLIVDYLNRGLSVAEIAARAGVSEKRMRAVIREILARRMPAPPEEFVAVQLSRLNEALLVAYSAMGPTNLEAVGHVVRIVRELDRYHGLFAGRRLPEAAPRTPVRALEAPVEGTMAFGAALTCRPTIALQDFEMIELSGEMSWAPAALSPVDTPRAQGFALAMPGESGQTWPERPAASGSPGFSRDAGGEPPSLSLLFQRDDRPESSPQDPEKTESAPGLATTAEASGGVDAAREQVHAFAPPEPARDVATPDAALNDRPENPPQSLDTVESAPGNTSPADASAPASAGASVVSPAR